MYHDSLLAAIIDSDPTYRPLVPISPHTRFTTACQQKLSLYKLLARALQLIKYTELLFEMGLHRKASCKTRSRSIVLLELVKYVLSYQLMSLSTHPHPGPPFASLSSASPANPSCRLPSPSETLIPPLFLPQPFHPLPLFPTLTSNHRPQQPHSISKTIAPPYPHMPSSPHLAPTPPHRTICFPRQSPLLPSSPHFLSFSPCPHLNTGWLKPSISFARLSMVYTPFGFSIRPLHFSLSASLLTFDRRSNRPLVTVLAMELLSRSLRRSPPPSATLERAEYARRDRDMLWYLLRGSIWQQYTRSIVPSFSLLV